MLAEREQGAVGEPVEALPVTPGEVRVVLGQEVLEQVVVPTDFEARPTADLTSTGVRRRVVEAPR